jgi:hypothetical protein
MSDLAPIVVEREGKAARFHGSWYRGPHTNFIPSKQDLRRERCVEEYFLKGWLPAAPMIGRANPVVAFGSCFARHITEHLDAQGYAVFGKDLGLNAHIIRFGEGMVNTFAIRQQLEWALGDREFPENLWFGPDKEIASLDPAIREETRHILERARVFIFTLGLSEIWFDKVSGEAFWRAIPAALFDPERHGFRVSSVEENLANLRTIVTLVRRLDPHNRVILTLSPIPLMATFRPVSCLTANSVSKAFLRVAIDQLITGQSGEANVFYFPSYEIVTELFPDPRLDDNRHIKPEIIRFVMDTFCRHYCQS